MKVALDISFLSLTDRVKKTGVYRYIYEIAKRLPYHLKSDLEFFVTKPYKSLLPIAQYLKEDKSLQKVSFSQLKNPQVEHYNEHFFPKKSNVIHYPTQTLSRAFESFGKQKRINTIHDVIPLIYPEYYYPEGLLFFNTFFKKLTPNDWILCPSHSAKNDICTYSNVDEKKVFPIHHAANPDIFYPCKDKNLFNELKNKYGLKDGRYLLCVGRLEERKNISHILTCFRKLLEQENIDDLYLVLTGPLASMSHSISYTYSHEIVKRGFQEKIIHIPFIEDKYLASLYSNALASIFLPIYEGFGLPVLEAMQCETPLITANNSSLPEIAEDASLMIDEKSEDALCQSILSLYSSQTLREKLINQGIKRSKNFTWEKYLDTLLNVYQTVDDSD